MKKAILVLGLTTVLVLALAGVAYANTSSTYLPATGSPHGAYLTNSEKCGVCHAVHKATPAGQILMRGTAADACTYCHITTATGVIRVYNGVETNYTGGAVPADTKVAHNSLGASCVTCHTPHAAASLILNHTYLEEKILKGQTLEAGLTVAAGDSADVAVSKWCTNCHNAVSSGQGTPYYETDYDIDATQASHVMISPSVNYAATAAVGTYAGVVAWSPSTTCRSCHADGVTNQSDGTAKTVASSYPHFTAGERFLTAAADAGNTLGAIPAADSEDDGVCIRCHVSGGAGAGLSY